MKINKKIRNVWHAFFYKSASPRGIEFALSCQNVTSDIDLHRKPSTLMGYLRFWLHLSLCQACKNYYDFSKVLSVAVKRKSRAQLTDLSKLNDSLLKKYAGDKDINDKCTH